MKRNRSVSVFVFVLLMVAMVSPAFAAGSGIAKLDSIADSILKILTSDLVSVILTIAIMGLGLGLIFSKDNDAMKKKFLVWLIAVGVLKGADEIVKMFWGS